MKKKSIPSGAASSSPSATITGLVSIPTSFAGPPSGKLPPGSHPSPSIPWQPSPTPMAGPKPNLLPHSGETSSTQTLPVPEEVRKFSQKATHALPSPIIPPNRSDPSLPAKAVGSDSSCVANCPSSATASQMPSSRKSYSKLQTTNSNESSTWHLTGNVFTSIRETPSPTFTSHLYHRSTSFFGPVKNPAP